MPRYSTELSPQERNSTYLCGTRDQVAQTEGLDAERLPGRDPGRSGTHNAGSGEQRGLGRKHSVSNVTNNNVMPNVARYFALLTWVFGCLNFVRLACCVGSPEIHKPSQHIIGKYVRGFAILKSPRCRVLQEAAETWCPIRSRSVCSLPSLGAAERKHSMVMLHIYSSGASHSSTLRSTGRSVANVRSAPRDPGLAQMHPSKLDSADPARSASTSMSGSG